MVKLEAGIDDGDRSAGDVQVPRLVGLDAVEVPVVLILQHVVGLLEHRVVELRLLELRPLTQRHHDVEAGRRHEGMIRQALTQLRQAIVIGCQGHHVDGVEAIDDFVFGVEPFKDGLEGLDFDPLVQRHQKLSFHDGSADARVLDDFGFRRLGRAPAVLGRRDGHQEWQRQKQSGQGEHLPESQIHTRAPSLRVLVVSSPQSANAAEFVQEFQVFSISSQVHEQRQLMAKRGRYRRPRRQHPIWPSGRSRRSFPSLTLPAFTPVAYAPGSPLLQ